MANNSLFFEVVTSPREVLGEKRMGSKQPAPARAGTEKGAARSIEQVRRSPARAIEPSPSFGDPWVSFTTRVFKDDLRMAALRTLLSRCDPRLPSQTVVELERSPLSDTWFGALAGAAEALEFPLALRGRLAEAMARRLAERVPLDDEGTWAAFRRLGSLLQPRDTGIFAAYLREPTPPGSRLAAAQVLARVLTPRQAPATVTDALWDVVTTGLSARATSPLESALLMNAVAALGATNDARLPEIVARISARGDAPFARQVRRRLLEVVDRLESQGTSVEAGSALVAATRALP
jgi:hypothetical protein